MQVVGCYKRFQPLFSSLDSDFMPSFDQYAGCGQTLLRTGAWDLSDGLYVRERTVKASAEQLLVEMNEELVEKGRERVEVQGLIWGFVLVSG